MQRRTYLKTILAAGAGLKVAPAQTKTANPIVLYVDMNVDPAKEKQMLDNYHNVFRPAAVKYPGYVDLKIVKLRSALRYMVTPRKAKTVPASRAAIVANMWSRWDINLPCHALTVGRRFWCKCRPRSQSQ